MAQKLFSVKTAYVVRSPKSLVNALDSYIHHDGITSRNHLINHILQEWLTAEIMRIEMGKTILELREKLGITQLDFAMLLGVHEMTISKWERGILEPNPWQLSIMSSFEQAYEKNNDIGPTAINALYEKGLGFAFFTLLQEAFEE